MTVWLQRLSWWSQTHTAVNGRELCTSDQFSIGLIEIAFMRFVNKQIFVHSLLGSAQTTTTSLLCASSSSKKVKFLYALADSDVLALVLDSYMYLHLRFHKGAVTAQLHIKACSFCIIYMGYLAQTFHHTWPLGANRFLTTAWHMHFYRTH